MDRKFFKILIFFLAAGWLIGEAHVSWAKFPEKKVRLIVPVSAGGGADTLARMVTRHANASLQDKMYVENVTGGGMAIGFREGAKAVPDGYTVTFLVTTLTTAPHVTKDYPTVDQYDHLCILATDPMMLSVHMDSPHKTIADLVAYAKANPGKLSVGTPGQGSVGHLGMAFFGDATGTQYTYVPFKGSAPLLAAAAGKHVDVATSTCSEGIALVGGKKLRPLLVFDAERSQLYPQAPTTKEAGSEVFISYWRAMAVPKGTPAEVKAVLVEAFRKAMEKEEVKKFLDQQGLKRVFLPPDQAGPWLKNQHDFFGKIAQKIGLQPQ
jgi:tripartite-type tricarboxylate transporter receptor subunit TctC